MRDRLLKEVVGAGLVRHIYIGLVGDCGQAADVGLLLPCVTELRKVVPDCTDC